MWSLLTLLIARDMMQEVELLSAASVAVAVECFICALDLLDDVEDGDQTPIVVALGPARVLNVSTTLIALAQGAILSLAEAGVDSSRILLLLNELQETTLVAAAGQHRDLLAEQRAVESFTYEECIEIAAGKAGSLMRLACRMGALCANAPDDIYAQFSELGELLGIAHQLDNDSHDLYYILQHLQRKSFIGTVKTDLARQKKTLPIILAMQTEPALQNFSLVIDEEKRKQCLNALHEGIISTWGICLLYRERAREQLQKIETQQFISYELRFLLGFT